MQKLIINSKTHIKIAKTHNKISKTPNYQDFYIPYSIWHFKPPLQTKIWIAKTQLRITKTQIRIVKTHQKCKNS